MLRLQSAADACEWAQGLGCLPCAGARANPMMAVCGNILWMLGGVVEVMLPADPRALAVNP